MVAFAPIGLFAVLCMAPSALQDPAPAPVEKPAPSSIRLRLAGPDLSDAERASAREACVRILKDRVRFAKLQGASVVVDGEELVLQTAPEHSAELEAALPRLIRRSRLDFSLVGDPSRDGFDADAETKRLESALEKVEGKPEMLSLRELDRELKDGRILSWVRVVPGLEERFPSKLSFQLVVRDPKRSLSNDCIESSFVELDAFGRPAMGFTIHERRRADFGTFTESNTGRRLAVVIDDEIFSAPTLNGRIESRGTIEGGPNGFQEHELKLLLATFKAGALPVALERVVETKSR